MSKSDSDLDRLIEETLDAEDRDLVDAFREEPGYFAQGLSLFKGPLGWVMWVGNIMNILFTGLAIWTGWQFFSTTDPLMSLRWGLATIVFLNGGLFFKGFLGQQLLMNRAIREIKRLELQIARGHSRESV
jgi:uncharacterized membrane protein